MQREIKFRAWSTQYNRFLDCETSQFQHYIHGYANPVDRNLNRKTITVQQYTGLKDKNGVDIYEGDILIFRPSYKESLGGQFGNAVFSTSFKDGSFRFGDEFAEQEAANYYEIIGNIFENPELLK